MNIELECELECLVDCASAAAWRRQRAFEYPLDERNVRAAEILDRLAEAVPSLEGSELHHRLCRSCQNNQDFGEIISENLRSVGFHCAPKNVSEFIESIIISLA